MQVHQVTIRPEENTVIVLYKDLAGGRQSLVFDSTGDTVVESVLALCAKKLPTDANHPAKAEIQREVTELENRIAQLKTAIGQA